MNLIGQHVGNYVVTRELGAGGMGTVYLAEHPTLGRKVAIKVLRDEHATDPDTVSRFFQEARAAAGIGEEHIIEVIDFGELTIPEGKVVYLMMELLEGMSLGKRLQQGAMPVADVAEVARQVCLALAASHAKGIIHRDLKPENIYLCPRPSNPLFTKVLDFGIAKLTGPTKASARTRAGTLLGTPAYMSPEQCLAAPDVDARADIYALGVVMFEMLTGQLPYSGSFGQLLEGHLQHPPDPPSRRNPTVPPAWDAIVLHCLEKGRDDRFASMDALAAAIQDPAAHLATYQQVNAARVTRPPPARRTLMVPGVMSPEPGAMAAPATPPPLRFVPMPPAIAAELGSAPTLSVTPTPMPFTAPLPLATPAPFSAAPPDAPAPPTLRVTSARVWLGAAILAVVVGSAVFGIATFVRGRSGEEPRPAAEVVNSPTDAAIQAITPDATAPVTPTAPIAPAITASVDASVEASLDASLGPPAIVDAQPAHIRVTITSTPVGAHVTVRHGTSLSEGVTPYVVELTPGSEPATITLTANGYAAVTRTLIPRVDAEVVVALERKPVDRPRRPRPRNDELIRPE
ncbi:MAG: serine/threonine protein kinase [Myxococcales bacterium]|nr:serine/threonine protein kinase [Myxococcales bacterium]